MLRQYAILADLQSQLKSPLLVHIAVAWEVHDTLLITHCSSALFTVRETNNIVIQILY